MLFLVENEYLAINRLIHPTVDAVGVAYDHKPYRRLCDTVHDKTILDSFWWVILFMCKIKLGLRSRSTKSKYFSPTKFRERIRTLDFRTLDFRTLDFRTLDIRTLDIRTLDFRTS